MKSSDPWNFLTLVRKGSLPLIWDVCYSEAALAASLIKVQSPGSVSSYSSSPPTVTRGGLELCRGLAAHVTLHRGQSPRPRPVRSSRGGRVSAPESPCPFWLH